MTSRIVVNNIQADAGISTVTFGSEISASRVTTSSGQFTVGTGASVYSPATNVLSLGTNNTEKVRIDSSGNFNLVNTAGIMTAFKYETPALINNHFKSQSTTAGAYVRMYAAASSGQWDIYGNGANLRFSDNASSGNIQMDRPLSMNSQNIIMSSGYGIDFSANTNAAGMTSELLDDYEEGTFTVTMQYFSGGGYQNATFTNTPQTTGYYVKVGKICTAYYYSTDFQINTGNALPARFEGLPFTAANLTEGYCAGSITHVTCFAQTVQNLYITPNSTAVVPIQQGTTSSSTWNNLSNVYIMWSITYRTN
jgi:hypothetical protein